MFRAFIKHKQLSKLGSLICALYIIFAIPALAQTSASETLQKLPNIPYITIDTDSSLVLNENRSFERWHPASLTKLMTAYVTFVAIKNGELTSGSPVTISRAATKMPPSKMGYKKGSQLRVDTAITILIVKSANDVAFALAESVAGSVPAFVSRMNKNAQQLGLKDSHFMNPHGLHHKNQYVSARDMLVLSKALWNEFPQYRHLFGTPSITSGKKTYYSYNLLLERFQGAMGMKTGFVCASGYNMVASAKREGKRLVTVVFGANSQTQRAVTAAKLLLSGFKSTSGTPISHFPRPSTIKGPTNMRPKICSEKARKNRYDPAAQNAIIKSAFLSKRKTTKQPIKINLNGITAPASAAWLARAFKPSFVPIPTPRPEYNLVTIDGEMIGLAMQNALRGTIPLPLKSPLTVQ
ncbi:MAG: D-alanyl-D-alanine carboxypeptidase [Hyphomicrobiales bacterium]|nr:MAG: D-alanyl-D-alanine carboxypeptidase [Hyphomicrobiales bacterium]PCH50382.1 MAG: D-alanyl-D-alanine carboxypeptidase [Hyphomicrobiales bacterium]